VLENLLIQIKNLLLEFNVEARGPYVRKEYLVDNEIHYVIYLNITNYFSMSNFYNRIGFINKTKMSKLEKILLRKKLSSDKEIAETNKKILALLRQVGNISTAELSSVLGMSVQSSLKRLSRLKEKGIIINFSRVNNNRSYLWKICGV
jgi:predicted HTH transcriptional regulator